MAIKPRRKLPLSKVSEVMAKRLYVGNLNFSTTSADLEALFAEHGSVQSAQVQVDRDSGKCRGFGFVVMEDDAEADQAIARLDGTEHRDRRLNVNEAQPRTPPGPIRKAGFGPGRSVPRAGFRPGGRS